MNPNTIQYLQQHWLQILYLVGMFFEIAGAFLIANRYVKYSPSDILLILLSALRRGPRAKRAALVARDLVEERGVLVLQGLAYLIIGFVLRSLTTMLELFT